MHQQQQQCYILKKAVKIQCFLHTGCRYNWSKSVIIMIHADLENSTETLYRPLLLTTALVTVSNTVMILTYFPLLQLLIQSCIIGRRKREITRGQDNVALKSQIGSLKRTRSLQREGSMPSRQDVKPGLRGNSRHQV